MFVRGVAEIRGGVFAAAAMVRPAAAVLEREPLRVPERDPPPPGRVAAGHLLHHARRLQRPAHPHALRPADPPQRHRQLSHEVTKYFRRALSIYICAHVCERICTSRLIKRRRARRNFIR